MFKIIYKSKRYILLHLLIFSFITFIISMPILKDSSILKTNDMMGNITNALVIKQTLIEKHTFPQWNFYVGQGIPITADPLSTFLNPFVFFVFLLFSITLSIKIIYLASIFFSGLFFYLLLRLLNINKAISFLLSFTFMASGYLSARIFAGHLEKILIYPVIPLLIISILMIMKKPKLFWSGVTALILTYFIFSGGIYEFFYSLIFISSAAVFILISFFINKNKDELNKLFYLIISILMVIPFSGAKTIPLIEISTYISHVKTPFEGSQNIISIIYNLFFPFKEIYATLSLDRFLESPYFWWESFAFVGLLPLVCLFLTPIAFNKNKNNIFFIFILFSITLFSMSGNLINPYHWITKGFEFIQQFRIPSRIFIYLVPVVLVLSGLILNYFYKNISYRKIILGALVVNFILVLCSFNNNLSKSKFIYSPPISDMAENLLYLKQTDRKYYYIAQSTLYYENVSSVDTATNKQKILNDNYGFKIKNNLNTDLYNKDYSGIYPKYFILPKNQKPPDKFRYSLVFEGSSGSSIYKNDVYSNYADIYNSHTLKLNYSNKENFKIKNVNIDTDQISVVVDSNSESDNLLLLESYSPGWKAYVDGNEIPLLRKDFLNVRLHKGNKTYIFKYHSNKFIWGFIITTFSIFLYFSLTIKRVAKN